MEDANVRKAALKNAIEHEGKASDSAVFSRLAGTDKSILSDVKESKKTISRIVSEVNALSIERQQAEATLLGLDTEKKKFVKEAGLKDLPNVKGEVVLRLPPEPSGFMHLGHAIAGMINYLYKEKYGGKLWLRFEDTNPNKVEKRFADSFREGYKWLGITWDEEKFISSDMTRMYEIGEKMINENLAYVCTCSLEKIKSGRLNGEECEHRGHTVEENRHMWNFVINGEMKPGEAVIRFKGNMKDKDFSLRDPNLFRIIKTDYKSYSLWPIYDFASVVEDDMCGITHVLRSNEFKVSFQDKLRDVLGLKKLNIVQFSRFNFTGTPFSKRKLRELIEKGQISGWDDIRLPTVSSIRRRGITPEAIKQFALTVGYSESKHEYEWDTLLTPNRRIIDDKSKRFFFVSNPQSLTVNGAGEKEAKIPSHPSVDLGFRVVRTDGNFIIDGKDAAVLKKGDLLRLKDLYTVRINDPGKEGIRADFVSDKMIGGERIVQWVTKDNLPVKILVVGNLLNEDGSFNENSLMTISGIAEGGITTLKEGETIQFERFGFCILDNKDTETFVYISR